MKELNAVEQFYMRLLTNRVTLRRLASYLGNAINVQEVSIFINASFLLSFAFFTIIFLIFGPI